MQVLAHRRSNWPFVLGLAAALAFAPSTFAASGTIDAAHSYAWGNIAGWANFAPANSTITVTDTGLTGYAWSPNDGWINLAPVQGGVTNAGGTLGGFAWDTAIGWVSFSGVTIDTSGRFHGQATGANGYTINFDCAKCDVRTTWRPSQSTTQTVISSPGAISPLPATRQQTTPAPVQTPTDPPRQPQQPKPSGSTPVQQPNQSENTNAPFGPTVPAGSNPSGVGLFGQHSTTTLATSGTTTGANASSSATTSTALSTFFRAVAVPSLIGLLIVIVFFAIRFFL